MRGKKFMQMENDIAVIIIPNMDSLSIIRCVIRGTFQNNHTKFLAHRYSSAFLSPLFLTSRNKREIDWNGEWGWTIELSQVFCIMQFFSYAQQRQKLGVSSWKNPDDRRKFAFIYDLSCRTINFFLFARSLALFLCKQLCFVLIGLLHTHVLL